MNRCFVIVAAVLILAISFYACSAVETTPPTALLPTSPFDTKYSKIVVYMMDDSPWPEVPVYNHPLEIYKIKLGDEVSMGFYVTPRLGQYWQAEYDVAYLSLVDEQVVYADPLSPVSGTAWFRFKAIKEGNTSINYDLISVGDVTLMSLLFNFCVTGH
jgi:hypothetical protein